MKFFFKCFSLIVVFSLGIVTGAAQKSDLPLGSVLTVSAPNATASATSTVLIPVTANFGSFEVSDYQFDIVYDPTILTPVLTAPTGATTACVTAGTMSEAAGISVTCFVNPAGRINLATFSSGFTLTGSGTLLYLRFQVAAGALPGATSPINFEDELFFQLSGQIPSTSVVAIDGTLTVLGPTAANASVGGRVTTPEGVGIARARVRLTNMEGEEWTALTNGFGFFQMEGVPVGQTYILSASSKQHSFQSVALNVVDDISDIVIISQN